MISPGQYLENISRKYPDAWKQVELFRKDRGVDLPKWPSWCFLPMAGWHSIVSSHLTPATKSSRQGLSMEVDTVFDVGRLAALGTWRYSKGIYRLNPDVMEHLWETPILGDMPTEILYRLPEWCVYIETPGKMWGDEHLFGFFAHLEWDARTERPELRLVLNLDRIIGQLLPIPLHLGPWSLTEAIFRVENEAMQSCPEFARVISSVSIDNQSVAGFLAPLLSLLLYICSDDPAYDDKDRPHRPSPTRIKAGWRMFPAEKPKVWMIGGAVGETIRKATETHSRISGHSVRPHLRKAHWHGYWQGKQGEQRFRYHWLPPIFVAGNGMNIE